jgi:hypothetical protein
MSAERLAACLHAILQDLSSIEAALARARTNSTQVIAELERLGVIDLGIESPHLGMVPRATTASETSMSMPGSVSDTADTGASSGIAGVGAQARQTTAGAETTADIGQSEAYALNLKRMVEEFLGDSLTEKRGARGEQERRTANGATNDAALGNIMVQALQNAVETANMVGKRAVHHSDVAVDRIWNVDEVAGKVVLDNAAIADMLKRSFGTTEMAEIIRGVVAGELSKIKTG